MVTRLTDCRRHWERVRKKREKIVFCFSFFPPTSLSMVAVDAPLLTTVGAEGYGARATTSAAQRHQHPLTTSGWSNARAKVLLLAVVAVCGAAFASTRGKHSIGCAAGVQPGGVARAFSTRRR